MTNDRAPRSTFRGSVVHRAVLPCMVACALYFGAPSLVQAQSGDGPVAGAIVDQLSELYGETDDVIVTIACLEGNPFVPEDPPVDGPTLSGCKLDISAGGGPDSDNNQLITVLPNNFRFEEEDLTNVNTFSSGSNPALEFDVTVQAVSKDIYLGLANPELFGSPPAASDVATTADVFCTSVDAEFDCAKIEPCSTCSTSPSSCGALVIDSNQAEFCGSLTGLLESAYNLVTNPLAYAVATNMTHLAEPGSVTLKLCEGFQAQCLPPSASPVASNVRVTSMHTQNAAVETPRLRLPYY
jgi:hypothetical protein